MWKKTDFFTVAELEKIKNAVHEAETKTSGEIVPMLVERSAHYFWIYWFGAFLGLALSSLLVLLLSHIHPWTIQLDKIFILQSVSAVLGATIFSFPAAQRLVIPSWKRTQNVHLAAHGNFIAAGLTETKHRTGVLIFISLLERRVQILADKGIHDKVDDNYWDAQVAEMVKGMRSGKACDVLVQVIQEIGNKLAAHFVPEAGDENELSDDLREGVQF